MGRPQRYRRLGDHGARGPRESGWGPWFGAPAGAPCGHRDSDLRPRGGGASESAGPGVQVRGHGPTGSLSEPQQGWPGRVPQAGVGRGGTRSLRPGPSRLQLRAAWSPRPA